LYKLDPKTAGEVDPALKAMREHGNDPEFGKQMSEHAMKLLHGKSSSFNPSNASDFTQYWPENQSKPKESVHVGTI